MQPALASAQPSCPNFMAIVLPQEQLWTCLALLHCRAGGAVIQACSRQTAQADAPPEVTSKSIMRPGVHATICKGGGQKACRHVHSIQHPASEGGDEACF